MSADHDSQSGSLARSSEPDGRGGAEADGDSLDLPAARGAGLDPLSDVLGAVRLTGAVFFQWDVSWPYATFVPAGDTFAPLVLPGARQVVSYHIVTHGACWGGLVGQPAVRLEPGDILLIPHGDAYVMSSSQRLHAEADTRIEPALEFFRLMADGALPFVVEDGGGGQSFNRVICGFLGCDLKPFNPVVAALPRIVRLRSGTTQGRLQTLVDFALSEARQARPGSRSVLLRLSELMFVEVVRCCVTEQHAARTGWLAGLSDPLVGRALIALHREPARSWTLEALARDVGSSRTQLAASFARIVGVPPMQYLTQWRMQLAAKLLSGAPAKVAAVARQVGYASEAAFSRAFKRFAGVSPARWRRR